jgi:predicted nucleotidyltransferase component of viral defense system
MIDRPALIAWRSKAPWPDRVQVEQDLLLSRLMIEIARDEILGPELTMRGGTCIHKLHLPSALRYSEDLDYVRSTHTGIKPYTQALTRIADEVGLTVSSRQRSGQMVHVYLDGEPREGIGRLRIKVEINIAETDSFLPRKTIRHTVQTSWWSGQADIPTYQAEEITPLGLP